MCAIFISNANRDPRYRLYPSISDLLLRPHWRYAWNGTGSYARFTESFVSPIHVAFFASIFHINSSEASSNFDRWSFILLETSRGICNILYLRFCILYLIDNTLYLSRNIVILQFSMLVLRYLYINTIISTLERFVR